MINKSFPDINSTQYQAVLLDLDGTLYDCDSCYAHAERCCFDQLQTIKPMSWDEFQERYQQAKRQVKANLTNQGSSHSRLLFFQRFFENLLGKTDIDLTLEFRKTYSDALFSQMKLFPEAEDFLKKCQIQGIKVCIVSDMVAKVQLEKIKQLRIERYIDYIVTSEEAGVEKPHERIFLLALEKLGLGVGDADKVLMVGDNTDKDIKGAQALGIKTWLVE